MAEGNENEKTEELLDPEKFDEAVDDLIQHTKDQRRRKNISILVACLAVVLAAIAIAIALSSPDDKEVQQLTTKVNTNADKLDEANKYIQELGKQFEQCKKLPKGDPRCAAPVVPTTPILTPERPEKTTEPAGLTVEQVRVVVAEEVARRNLTLTPAQVATVASEAAKRVPKPKDGKTPTTAQITPLVSAAVGTFCANDRCRGKDGADAPAVTAEQLGRALAAYCEPRNDCIGDDGPAGDRGPRGYGVSVKVAPDNEKNGTLVTFTSTDPGAEPVSFFVPNGKDGTNGTDGEDAFPFTFTFKIPATATEPERSYTCTITKPGETVEC